LGFRRSRSFPTDGPWDPKQTLLGKGATLREKLRPYRDEDAPAVHQVHLRGFGGREDEARLVELLHAAGAAPVSLVATAEPDGRVVGHVLFSPVQLPNGRGDDPPTMVGLAPVAVLPEHQGRGIGSRLVRDGLKACREAGYAAAVVLGEPGYYSRFGFERASARALGNEYGADEHFMVAELGDGALGGTVRYRSEFGEVDA
jgi:putative acetyltransferase